jgi:hypothetical protein
VRAKVLAWVNAVLEAKENYALKPRPKGHKDLWTRVCIDFIGGHSRIRTYDFHRVKVALYR